MLSSSDLAKLAIDPQWCARWEHVFRQACAERGVDPLDVGEPDYTAGPDGQLLVGIWLDGLPLVSMSIPPENWMLVASDN